MPEFGFPAQARSANLRSIIAQLRGRSDDARVAATTSRFADVTAELGGRVNELMQIEKSFADLRSYAEAIALSEARSDTAQAALEIVSDAAQGLADTADLLKTNGNDLNFEVLSRQARNELGSIISALNTNLGGRTLFSGDRVGSPALASAASIYGTAAPVLEGQTDSATAYAALEAEFIGSGTLFDTAIYLGGPGNAPATEVAPGEIVRYGVKSDEAPIRRVLLNVVVIAAAFDRTNAIPDNQRKGLLDRASGELRNSMASFVSIQSRLGADQARIATVKARNIATEASLTIAFNELAAADPFDAAANLTELEGQIEVAFATTARLANLTLANFR